MNIRRYLYNQNWNIGFAEISPERLMQQQSLPKIKWLKHPYKDRFFADPFILNASDKYIFVLVEELVFGDKGALTWLKIDKKTYLLLERKQILQLDTHLSYPQIIRTADSIFVIPENSESGKLTVYRFNEKVIVLEPLHIIADEPLTDATLLKFKDSVYMISTMLPNSLEDAYLYKYDHAGQKFKKVYSSPIIKDLAYARMGGAFFKVGENVFRPAQDCKTGYGKALTICKVEALEPTYLEKPLFRIEPKSWRYNLGLHTINFDSHSSLAVIDSYGYLYPTIGRILMALYNIKHKILR